MNENLDCGNALRQQRNAALDALAVANTNYEALALAFQAQGEELARLRLLCVGNGVDITPKEE